MSQTTVCSRHKLDPGFTFAHFANNENTNAVLFEFASNSGSHEKAV